MKILYAIQATGNGHISRAIQLLPYLEQLGEVDIFLSGDNYSLTLDYPIKYQSQGVSLYFNECGDLNFFKTFQKAKFRRILKEANELPVEKYDLIINDFEYITARACKIKNRPSVQFGHQASFMSPLVPRPARISKIGEFVLSNFAKSTDYLGLHFQAYDDFVLNPIIKERIINATPKDKGHITVYLPSYLDHCLKDVFHKMSDVEFHWFIAGNKEIRREHNIKYFPIDNHLFSYSLQDCHGIITGGGFETPSEALYLQKKLLSIPITNHYEQQCNAEALRLLGVDTIPHLKVEELEQNIRQWLNKKPANIIIQPNIIRETIDQLSLIAESHLFMNRS